MSQVPEDKSIELATDYKNHIININFSDNLTDDEERGYILSAAFFSYCASEGLTKEDLTDMVSSYYDEFLNSESE